MTYLTIKTGFKHEPLGPHFSTNASRCGDQEFPDAVILDALRQPEGIFISRNRYRPVCWKLDSFTRSQKNHTACESIIPYVYLSTILRGKVHMPHTRAAFPGFHEPVSIKARDLVKQRPLSDLLGILARPGTSDSPICFQHP